MGDHDHDAKVAMFGECPVCIVADAEGPIGVLTAASVAHHHPDGATYTAAIDHARLGAQAARVWDAMVGGDWCTLAELAARTGDPEASVSARLRDLRKLDVTVQRRRRDDAGTWEYRVPPVRPERG